jgi:ribosome biogenesis GTPase
MSTAPPGAGDVQSDIFDAGGLRHLGWTTDRDADGIRLQAAGLVPGRVSLEHNHVYRVLTAAGERLAEVAGRMKHQAGARVELPVVGDWVGLRLDDRSDRAQIREILPRGTRFSRKVAGRVTVEQVLAANIDTVFVVFALGGPLKTRAIERYLVAARQSGARARVVLNKRDLAEDLDASVRAAAEVADGTPVHAVSARTGEGIDALAHDLDDGQTVALLGPSGVGKSSIVNRLVGDERLPTGEVRPWDSRGRHTSVHRQLVVRAAGGLVIDTPGIRELQVWETRALDDAFADIAELADACRFRDCQHDREPGCAVKAAVDAGVIAHGRYQNFLKLQQEERELAARKDARGHLRRDRR